MKKVVSIVFILMFCAVLLLPVIFLDYSREISETENRRLAALPSVLDKELNINSEYPYEFADWYEDHLGFRDGMMDIYAKTMVRGFGLSTSDQVVFGRDGWMFYTLENNIKLVTGGYPIDEVSLGKIAAYQQRISDYYKERGAEYYLVITPSKATVYPEYVLGGRYSVGETAADMTADYIRENTDVKVINVKDALIAAKGEGQLFMKTDSHWNGLGSYNAYKYIVSCMQQYGSDITDPMTVSFDIVAQTGDFAGILGSQTSIPPEQITKAAWNRTAERVKVDEDIEKLNASLCDYSAVSYLNESSVSGKKLLIYGDSMWSRKHGQIADQFAEHFSAVLNTRIRSVSCEMDDLYAPDTIIFACTERMISQILTVPPDLPALAEEMPEYTASLSTAPLPETDKAGRGGLWIDKHGNNTGLSLNDFDYSENMYRFTGWAVDCNAESCITDLFVTVGDKTFRCDYGFEKSGVVKKLGGESYRYSGFRLCLSKNDVKAGDRMEFTMINRNTNTVYERVVYELKE